MRNTFVNNFLTDLKLSKAQLSEIIQPGGFFAVLLNKFAVPKVDAHLA